jgi:hypothetical protein
VLHGLLPVVRAEVLRLLFTNPGQELHGHELARLSFLAVHTVQDELAKLEGAGLIVSRSNGYQRFFRANPKHPLHTTLRRLVIEWRRPPSGWMAPATSDSSASAVMNEVDRLVR